MSTTVRIHPFQWLVPLLALLATLSAHLRWELAFIALKPMPVLLLMASVWLVADRSLHGRATWWLLVGLAFSVQGDVWLLWSQGFIPGLASFWLAHACYVALLRRTTPQMQRTPWQPALACYGAGAIVYAYLWSNGLPTAMRWPVAAYVLVITAMSTYAIARAMAWRTPASCWVAVGAVCFMCSDAVLAINKFVQPVPAAQLWILGSYYLAQWLIVYGMLQALGKPAAKK